MVDQWASGVRIAGKRQLQTRRGSFNLVRPKSQDEPLLQQDLVEIDHGLLGSRSGLWMALSHHACSPVVETAG